MSSHNNFQQTQPFSSVQVIPSSHSGNSSNNNPHNGSTEKQQANDNYRITRAGADPSMYRRSDSSVSGESGPRGRVSPVNRGRYDGGGPGPRGGGGGGPPDDYYGRDRNQTVSSSNHGRRGDDPYSSRGPPPSRGEPGPRDRDQGPPLAGRAGQPRGSQSSETLSMAEQDFLAKYGYSGGRGESSGMPGAHHSMGPPGGGGGPPPPGDRDSGYNNRPRMPRMGGPGMGGDPRDRYVPGGGQSVNSHMTESVMSQSRMPRMGIEEEMEMQRTQQSRGGGGGRSRSPVRPRYPPADRAPDRVPRPYDRVQNYNNNHHNNNYPPPPPPPDRGYPQGPPPPRRNPYGDDDQSHSYADGMDGGGPPQRRMMMQRMPSQSTISTSGFRSFYSDAYTIHTNRDRDSVSTGYHNYYDNGPPPPPPRDDYHSSPPHGYGGSGASVNSRGRSPYGGGGYGGGGGGSGGSVTGRNGGGGYYGGGPPPPRRGPPPPRDYSPRRQHAPPPPQQRGPPPGQPDRPLLEVAPGLMMHLMGTDETMKAIQRGQITVTSCVVCGMDVHCHSASEYVLCPDCRVVSPVNQLDNAGDMTPQQGGLVGLGVKTEMLITMLEAGGQQY